ncbi:hypothetical protein CEUSTIGMA_g8393.t1 [Chlamydomonas eustigma]|uniref:NADP-dependent oxidoreductase domain-containing protein n=1 Tax=Chlamydomonas eustigma TaxID=1157962 RepID=A0A250XCZ2_9CHLO|nr:hypothetical protein CEUSTIGMA_g8393.t1 [Chlamydomonas eustigma]|eukprot:GAX80958.1 hypothetical protein CEUSTIGMA_g8393.t1 [Chlamydomonas eustigma]
MAQDGSIEVTWKGQAFSYLVHHPNSFLKTENYGSARASGSHAAPGHHTYAASGHMDGESDFQAGTGTWNGPAPTGARGMRQKGATEAPEAAAPIVKEPQHVRLSSGASMPIIGLGTAGIKSPEAVKTALQIGYRHLDCAQFYGNEEVVGQGIADFVAEGKRQELFVVSKVWNTHHRPSDVRAACEKSLKDLGLTYLDLYLIHWPEAWTPETQGLPGSPGYTGPADPATDNTVTIEQTWSAMESLVEAGLVKSIGVSNFSLVQVEALMASCKIKPAINQIELHPMLAQRKLVGVLFRKGVHCVAYSPLGSPGTFKANDLREQPAVLTVAKESGKTPAQVILKWNLQRGIAVIPKASSEAHLRENLEGCFVWRLSNDHKALLDTMDCNKRFIDFPWKNWGSAEEGGVTKPSTVVL